MKKLSSNSFKVSVAPTSGADATTYWLVPSTTQVKRKADGTHLPEYVSCECFSKTGNGNPVSGIGTIKFVLTYKTGSNSAEFVYGSRIIIPSDMAAISFRLYVGDTQVDEKTVSVVEDGQDGGEGLPGPAGPLIYPAGKYDDSIPYTRTPLSAPMVLCEKLYYMLNKEGTFTGINPKEDYAANGKKATWVYMEKVEYAFYEILMANNATLASAVFYGDYMFSQHGKDASGNPTADYGLFDPAKIEQSDCPFTPNLMMDLLFGKLFLSGGKTMFDSDGGGYLANGNIKWLPNGNVTIKANISYPSYRFYCDGRNYPMKTIDLTKSYNISLGVNRISDYTAVCMMPNPNDFPDIEVTIYSPNITTRSSPSYFIRNYNGGDFMYNRKSWDSSFKFNEINCTGIIAKFKSIRLDWISDPVYWWFLINLNEVGTEYCTTDKYTKQ